MLVPKLFTTLRNYNRRRFTGDLSAGILVGVVGRFRRSGTRGILTGVHAQPMAALQRSAFVEEMPKEDLVGTLNEAVALARAHVETPG